MSKRAVLLQVLLTALILIPLTVSSQIHLSGSLSGVLIDTTYIVDWSISVEERDSLLIEPGAEFFFNNNSEFTIYGYLYAAGTEEDSIIFQPNEEIISIWKGISFDDAVDGSIMSYCIITGGFADGSSSSEFGGGILVHAASPTFYRCSIRANESACHGGGVYCYGYYLTSSCTPRFIECVIANNCAADDGGGMSCYRSAFIVRDCIVTGNYSTGEYGGGGGIGFGESSPLITGCLITDNSAATGGGIAGDHCWDVRIKNCIISGNTASWSGGGLAVDEESMGIKADSCWFTENMTGGDGGGAYICCEETKFTKCVFTRNFAGDDGGAIGGFMAHTVLENCTITDNCAEGEGGALFFYSFNHDTLRNCIFSDNRGLSTLVNCNTFISCGRVEFCDFYDNLGEVFTGRWAAALGQVNCTNANGDSCDHYRNIFLDPMFVDPIAGDYNLLADSPCIDAGHPHSDFDPDGTVADLGAFYFDQSLQEISAGISNFAEPVPLEDHLLLTAYPNPFNAQSTVEFSLPSAQMVSLKLFDVLGREAAGLYQGFQPPGSHRITIDGSALSSGIYWLRLSAGEHSQTHKILLVK